MADNLTNRDLEDRARINQMSQAVEHGDEAAIDTLIAAFYSAFDNRGGRKIESDALRWMFLAEAVIIRANTIGIDAMTVDTFIAPRVQMLSDGTLSEFAEWETYASTLVLNDIACRRSTYEKHGIYRGTPYNGEGSKLIQLVRTNGKWQIAAITWEDRQ